MSNFQPLEVVGRRSETQFQVGENSNKRIGVNNMLFFQLNLKFVFAIFNWVKFTDVGYNSFYFFISIHATSFYQVKYMP